MFQGSRIQQTFSRGSTKENYESAREWLILRERQSAGLPSGSPRSLEEAIQTYLRDVEGSVGADTHASYNRMLSTVLRAMQTDSVCVRQQEINRYVTSRRAEGAGRVIAKELSALKTALKYHAILPSWVTPASLKQIPKRTYHVPSSGEVRSLMADLSPESRSGLLMALLAGLRDAEVYRVEVGNYSQAESLLRIPAEIRKNRVGNVVPTVSTLDHWLACSMATGTIIPVSKSVVKLELSRLTSAWAHPWSGFQPARRALVTWAEDAGYTHDTIALVTGHARTGVVSRYSAEHGRLDLKRAIIESVEGRLLNA